MKILELSAFKLPYSVQLRPSIVEIVIKPGILNSVQFN